MTVQSLRDLFVYELRGMYYTETQLVEALDDMALDATEDEVTEAFAEHRDETRTQIDRLERVFAAIEEEPEMREVAMVDALVQEREEFLSQVTDPDLRNLFYLGAGVKTERIEISGYEHLLVLAERLDMPDDASDLLEENLDEEEAALKKLKSMTQEGQLSSLIARLTG